MSAVGLTTAELRVAVWLNKKMLCGMQTDAHCCVALKTARGHCTACADIAESRAAAWLNKKMLCGMQTDAHCRVTLKTARGHCTACCVQGLATTMQQ